MRASTVCLGLLVFCSLADASPRKKRQKKKQDDAVDISKWKDQMQVWTDNQGGYIVGVPSEMESLFYGDGKQMYQQRVFSASMDGPKWEMAMWSPRVNNKAEIDLENDRGTLTCGNDVFDIQRLPDDAAKKIIEHATFSQPMWKRQAEKLSRDDRGTYYYVDKMRDEYGGKGYRLFAGPKGAMKELPLTNIVSDSEGEIFSSKKGELRFVQDGDKATWIAGEKKTELTPVPVEDNVQLIYGELGVYEGSLGTPCDEY